MRATGIAALHSPPEPRADPIREAAARLLDALPDRTDAQVLVDFLEDDLREGLAAVADVEAHFTDVLDALRSERVERLASVVSRLRRLLCQGAGKIHAAYRPRRSPLQRLGALGLHARV